MKLLLFAAAACFASADESWSTKLASNSQISSSNLDALKAASKKSLEFIKDKENQQDGMITVGGANDEIHYGTYQGEKIIYFSGSDTDFGGDTWGTLQEWLSNANCAFFGGCDSVAEETFTKLKNANFISSSDDNVICAAFSRGNYLASAYVADNSYNVCDRFVAVASPGMMKDPTGNALTILIGGSRRRWWTTACDPVASFGRTRGRNNKANYYLDFPSGDRPLHPGWIGGHDTDEYLISWDLWIANPSQLAFDGNPPFDDDNYVYSYMLDAPEGSVNDNDNSSATSLAAGTMTVLMVTLAALL